MLRCLFTRWSFLKVPPCPIGAVVHAITHSPILTPHCPPTDPQATLFPCLSDWRCSCYVLAGRRCASLFSYWFTARQWAWCSNCVCFWRRLVDWSRDSFDCWHCQEAPMWRFLDGVTRPSYIKCIHHNTLLCSPHHSVFCTNTKAFEALFSGCLVYTSSLFTKRNKYGISIQSHHYCFIMVSHFTL